MYINPFWAGVAATILAEFALLVVYAIVQEKRKEKRRKRAIEFMDKQLNISKNEK